MVQHSEFNCVYKIRNYLNYKSRSTIISIVTLKMEGRHPFFMCLEGRTAYCQQSVSFILATSGQHPESNIVSFLANIAHVTKKHWTPNSTLALLVWMKFFQYSHWYQWIFFWKIRLNKYNQCQLDDQCVSNACAQNSFNKVSFED